MLLEDRVVIVSGIGPGLGRELAIACATHGADVVLAARTTDRLAEVAGVVEELGRRALPVPTDVTDTEQVESLIASAESAFGGIDVVINNAFAQPPFASLEAMDLDDWYSSLEINCTAALRVSRAALPALRRRGAGSIVNIATMSIRNNKPNFGAYAAAKSALTSVTRTMANEVGPDQIRVNAVCPGFIMGDSVRWYLETLAGQAGTSYEAQYEAVASEIALRFIPDAAHIAGAVVFFASDLSAAVTGTSLDVNGGHVTTW